MTLFLHGFGLCAFFLSRMDYFDLILYTRDGLSFHLSSMHDFVYLGSIFSWLMWKSHLSDF